MKHPTEEQFLKDVSNHKMSVLQDTSVYRHLVFSSGSLNQRFELVTWPEHLVICGDMGGQTFCRIRDMFELFRMRENDLNDHKDRKLNINTGYWAEKIVAKDPRGYEQFCRDYLKSALNDEYQSWDFEDSEYADQVWSELSDIIEDSENEQDARYRVEAYQSTSGHTITDFFETNLTDYTYHYIWQLYAIVWGIQQYDTFKEREGEKGPA